ncbi:TIGR02391 family protein [Candidatus Poribacteria bacterium]|nr:MAG: TIGR02391 family protein [Candidatus Poribacteria bacterium]
MQSIHSLLPDHKILLELEPEELAGIILEYLNSGGTKKRRMFSLSNLTSGAALRDYPRESESEICYALAEAWIWLENQGLIAPDPSQNGGWYFITRRGHTLEDRTAVEAYRKANLLPKELLHPIMIDKVWPLFLRGEYDTAAFQSFKEVAVAVRYAVEDTEEDCDVELMEKAFHPEDGKMTDANQTKDEKQATLALFTGAMGLYKNPLCHRNINFTAEGAAEAIIFASHLFKIVDSSTSASTTP